MDLQERLIEIMIEDGIELMDMGTHYKAKCPFHDDNNPSFVMYKHEKVYRCYGCGEWGDIFHYLKHTRGMGYKRAVQYLGLDHGKNREVVRKKDTLIEMIIEEESTGVDVISKYGADMINDLLIQELERLCNGKDDNQNTGR